MKFKETDLHIRLYEPSDAKTISTMLRKEGQTVTAAEFDRGLDEPGERIRENTFVVLLGRTIVAYASLCFVDLPEQTNVYCYATVDVDWRRRGIGSLLFDFAVEHLKRCARREKRRIVFIHRADTGIPGVRQLAERHRMRKHTEMAVLRLPLHDRLPSSGLPPQFAFREPGMNDAAEWADVYNDAFASPGAKKAGNVVHEFESGMFSPRLYMVCEHERAGMAGFVSSCVHDGQARILTMAVRRKFQGIGLGKALLAEILLRLRQAGAAEAALSVDVRNERALALYTGFGFQRCGGRLHYTMTIEPS